MVSYCRGTAWENLPFGTKFIHAVDGCRGTASDNLPLSAKFSHAVPLQIWLIFS
ncbi:hypothetical protein [Microseira wollei]|uniref:hypothetical protein n=1 Tax=Microseira wollei TaxID=467598 RepID=UPI001CFD137B|nr:hypothetical protein [Microseira wollei]